MIGNIDLTLWIIQTYEAAHEADNWATWQKINKAEAAALAEARKAADDLGYLLLKDLEDAKDKSD